MGILGGLLLSLFGAAKKAGSDFVQRTEEFKNSEEGQAILRASQAKRASDEMDKTLKEMYDMEKELSDDD